ncbi:Beta-lactamase-type transpeptidase fold domain containing protein [Hirsutella rhossiliensis]|uniref:Beta-lactamase-type transpeptidase fold domain containing protein n=1 Tax=Hirsutella rhossiliensis TaxID=111463 RepID=A0A9P8SHJ8_9HYPO|nr:Beta-lactamase-type transpeptidase fold domain containing protein [Hirsutella rhossiliensis]KAH0961610.1 Beta-lactamase-type transpeptidase fold domain containing protein [Hirsutella rhossiliensis]
MPCFKGIAVSIHANGSPLPEYGIQRQSRLSRISNYIPVPQPSLSGDSNKPEPAKFAISITLLTPGLPIPYSAPKPSDSNPYPKPHFVGSLHPGSSNERGKFAGIVTPYIPMTNSENETIAAYIYFDGRAKEEVATLLRPGEETWVNSRWVQIPDSEGGGLAEREFLFREVGLERWLNGLDLQGHDAAENLERRRQKFEKRQRRQNRAINGDAAVFDSDSWSDDDDEPPEATGQIKVAMFRVLASGEIKKGEYSPQFDAHDGDDETAGTTDNGINADVEHTTSFAKPKSLDPKTISTQTVTGIDGPDKPYAVFTFFYRGDRQLQKIGVMQSSKNTQATPGSVKRRSGQLDFSSLGPLKAGGTVGFTAFRDQDSSDVVRRRKARKKSNGHIADDSEDEDDDVGEIVGRMEDLDDKVEDGKLTEDDPKFGGDLADGVNRIRLKRAHSTEPDSRSTPEASQRTAADDSPTLQGALPGQPLLASQGAPGDAAEALVGSPLKKARPSVAQSSAGDQSSASQSLSAALDAALSGSSAPHTTDAMTTTMTTTTTTTATTTTTDRVEEEL